MFRFLRRGILGLASLLVLVGAAFVGIIRLSLPDEDGVHFVAGLAAPTEIGFDSFGIPHIRANSREDAFAALGYVTARDRLFQLDLFRRKTAGRLAEIFGEGLVKADSRSRVMGFDHVARTILARLPQEQRSALTSYAAGVNRVLQETWIWPVEFYVLGYRPEAWRPEDSILVFLGMVDLVSDAEFQERTASVMRRSLPPKVVEFLTPEADCFNEILAPRNPAHCAGDAAPVEELEKLLRDAGGKRLSGLVRLSEMAHGSNGWVVARGKTRDGRAILANDMHLGLSVPNIWYRAELNYGSVRLAGLTLPGLPILLIGSNGKVAWGLTNLRADVSDLVRIERASANPAQYRTAEGSRSFGSRTEVISVRGAPNVTLQVKETIWGPVLPEPLLGEEVAVHSTALDPAATNLDIIDMDGATSALMALSLFHHAGGPPLNVLLADSRGNIAWTIMGKLPKRFGMDGLFSESWADGKEGWDGYLLPDELPSLVNPQSGFLVNTNQRMLSAAEFGPTIGHEFQGGFRAWRATERLRDLSRVTEADLLSLQLDTASEYYRYYQNLALRVLKAPNGELGGEAETLRHYLEAWDGRAELNSLGLPLLVEFSEELLDAILSPIVARCREVDPSFELAWSTLDNSVQRVIETDRPELLPDRTKYRDWPSFVRAVLMQSARRLSERYGLRSIEGLNWGQVNRVEMAHPLSSAVPLIGRVLDMPRLPLPGCVQCLRFAYENLGANARMVVAPGHEADGILQLAGGQSGQPGSIHYADQQASWVAGGPTPFLGGEEQHRTILLPLP